MWATRYPIKRITTRVKCKNKKNTQFTAELQGQTTNKHKEKHKNNKNAIYKECAHIWGTKNTYADIRKTQKMNKKDAKRTQNYRKDTKSAKNNKNHVYGRNNTLFVLFFVCISADTQIHEGTQHINRRNSRYRT